MNMGLINVGVSVAKRHLDDLPATTSVKDCIRAAFRAAIDFGMIVNDEDIFKAGVGAAILHFEEHKNRAGYDLAARGLTHEIKALSALSMMIQAGQMGMSLSGESIERIAEEKVEGWEACSRDLFIEVRKGKGL